MSKLSSLPSGKLDHQNKQSRKCPFFSVPLVINQGVRFNFGFASNMVLLLWCLCGGLLLHMLEANFLTILLKLNYEKAVNTAEEIVERGLTVIDIPGAESKVKMFKNSPYYNTRKMAERTIVAKVLNVILNS